MQFRAVKIPERVVDAGWAESTRQQGKRNKGNIAGQRLLTDVQTAVLLIIDVVLSSLSVRSFVAVSFDGSTLLIFTPLTLSQNMGRCELQQLPQSL